MLKDAAEKPIKTQQAKLASGTSQKSATGNEPASPPQKLHVGRELLDTTWRMTVPIVGFALIGIALDIALGSKPWLTLVACVVGFYFAMQLIKRQINKGNS